MSVISGNDLYLSRLFSSPAFCGWAQPWEAIIIGAVGALIACYGVSFLEKFNIDDPVGSISIHLFPAIWAMIATGLLLEPNLGATKLKGGVFKTGNFVFLGVQLLAVLVVTLWCGIMALIILFLISKSIGLRVSYQEEVLGADIVEHSIGGYSKGRRGGVSQANPRRTLNENQNVEANFETIMNNLDHLRKIADMHMKNENDGDTISNGSQSKNSSRSVDECSDVEDFEEPIVPPPRVRFVYE
jgi:hypothetical protein